MSVSSEDHEPIASFQNFLGQTIEVGDTVVYPAMSGRSTQLSEGVVLAIRGRTEEAAERGFKRGRRKVEGADRVEVHTYHDGTKWTRTVWDYEDYDKPREEWEHRIHEPVRLKIKPTGRDSRWRQHWSYADQEPNTRAQTLSANAPSVVLVQKGEK